MKSIKINLTGVSSKNLSLSRDQHQRSMEVIKSFEESRIEGSKGADKSK